MTELTCGTGSIIMDDVSSRPYSHIVTVLLVVVEVPLQRFNI